MSTETDQMIEAARLAIERETVASACRDEARAALESLGLPLETLSALKAGRMVVIEQRYRGAGAAMSDGDGVMLRAVRAERCPRCDGLGKITAHSVPCSACKGSGEVAR